jgi:hypothetical protein
LMACFALFRVRSDLSVPCRTSDMCFSDHLSPLSPPSLLRRLFYFGSRCMVRFYPFFTQSVLVIVCLPACQSDSTESVIVHSNPHLTHLSSLELVCGPVASHAPTLPGLGLDAASLPYRYSGPRLIHPAIFVSSAHPRFVSFLCLLPHKSHGSLIVCNPETTNPLESN